MEQCERIETARGNGLWRFVDVVGRRRHVHQVELGGVLAKTVPAADVVFAEHVRELLQLGVGPRPEDACEVIERRLRDVYPKVRATVRTDLAGFGGTLVYVFRDGSVGASLAGEDWIDDPGTARTVTDPSGTYVEANEPAERLFGRTADEIVGSVAGGFTRPDARVEDAAAMWRALERTGRLHSLAVITCRDGTETPVEFVTVKAGDGPGRNVTYLRERQ
jgi:PAS domain S-box-containing protein